MSDEHEHVADHDHAGDLFTAEQRAAIAEQEQRWRTKRLKQDLDEAKRRLEVAIQLLADAAVFLDDEH